jgi:hypothetical protein
VGQIGWNESLSNEVELIWLIRNLRKKYIIGVRIDSSTEEKAKINENAYTDAMMREVRLIKR